LLTILLFGAPICYATNNNNDVGTIEGYFIPSGMYGGHSGYYTWMDYCPLCHHYNCLLNNPKGTYEGEVTCGICDSDYDGTTGADKHGDGAWAFLIEYVEPEPIIEAPQPQTQSEPVVVVKSQLEQMRDIYNNNSII